MTHMTHHDALCIEGGHAHARARVCGGQYKGSASCASCASCGEALADLARRVSRLRPDHRKPEQFHEDKSEIVAALRRLAGGVAR